MIRYAAIALALTLTACGSGEDAGNNSAEAGDTQVEQTPSNLQVDPNNTVVVLDNASQAAARPATVVAAIPAGYVGRWGLGAADCDPARADNKGLMIVVADRLTFYESRAMAGNIRLGSPTTLTTDLAFSGEGQTWTQTATLTLLDGGRTLVREVVAGDDLGEKGALRYSRCPTATGAA